MTRILICIRCGGNRGLNYFSTFYPPSFRRCPFVDPRTIDNLLRPPRLFPIKLASKIVRFRRADVDCASVTRR
jgi:hypothetical protein